MAFFGTIPHMKSVESIFPLCYYFIKSKRTYSNDLERHSKYKALSRRIA